MGTEDDLMYEDLFIVTFFGFLRAAEICGSEVDIMQNYLSWGAVSIHSDFIDLSIDGSKGDIFRESVSVKEYRNDSMLCPHRAIKRRFAKRKKDSDAHTPVFRTVAGSHVSYKMFQAKLKAIIKSVGYNASDYSTHSFRIGAATTLAILGFPASHIKTLGRWKSLVYQVYTRLDDRTLSSASKMMANAFSFNTAVNATKGGLGLFHAIDKTSVDDLIVSFSVVSATSAY